jgi:hypothetical protein
MSSVPKINIKAFLDENRKYAEIGGDFWLEKDMTTWITACQLKQEEARRKAERKKNMADILAFAELLEDNPYDDEEDKQDAMSYLRSEEAIESFEDIMNMFKDKHIMVKIKSLIACCEAADVDADVKAANASDVV